MAKKKGGLARPVRWVVDIDGGKKGDKQSYLSDLKEAVEKAKKRFDRTPSLVKVRTSRVRIQVQSGRMNNYRRTVGWIFRRTFVFE